MSAVLQIFVGLVIFACGVMLGTMANTQGQSLPPNPSDQEQIRCDHCECWRWDKEYEYEYCAKDPDRMRLQIYQPSWCPKLK